MGVKLLRGCGTPFSFLWEQAAYQAAVTLSKMYEKGIGVEKDEEKAAEWREVAGVEDGFEMSLLEVIRQGVF